jgi:hypothetical protein
MAGLHRALPPVPVPLTALLAAFAARPATPPAGREGTTTRCGEPGGRLYPAVAVAVTW